jgi:hypothetical protein
MFNAAFFIITANKKQPKCACIADVRYSFKEYFPVIKKE